MKESLSDRWVRLVERRQLSWEGYLLFDETGALIAMNRAANERFGYASRPGPLAFSQILARTLGSLYLEIIETLRVEHVFQDEVIGIRRTGETFPVEIRAGLLDESPAKILAVVVRESGETLASLPEATLKKMTYHSGIGQVATGVLHNIGNILNSMNITAQNLAEIAGDSRINSFLQANKLLKDNLHQLQKFVTDDPSGRYLPIFFERIGEFLQNDNRRLGSEVSQLKEHLNLVKDLIATQQDYARGTNTPSHFQASILLEEALRMELPSLQKYDIHIIREFAGDAHFYADKSKVIHILLNLIKNAKEAILGSDKTERRLRLEIKKSETHLQIIVADNGAGIPAEHLGKIFQYGFSTKVDGHGFGLYTSQQVVQEMGGSLTVDSGGVGEGTEFVLTLPSQP